jgi:hypothetical protein
VSEPPETRRDGLRAALWRSHENPRSGWSRVPLWPVFLYALYHRKPKLFAAGVGWALLNPVAFSPPTDDDAWMTRVVRAERWWTEVRGRELFDLDYPNVLNLANAVASLVAIWGALARRPRATVLGGAAAMAFKFWFVAELVARYDRRTDGDASPD